MLRNAPISRQTPLGSECNPAKVKIRKLVTAVEFEIALELEIVQSGAAIHKVPEILAAGPGEARVRIAVFLGEKCLFKTFEKLKRFAIFVFIAAHVPIKRMGPRPGVPQDHDEPGFRKERVQNRGGLGV